MAQQPQREVVVLSILGGLGNAARPFGDHVCAARAVEQLAEAVGSENEEGARSEAPVNDVRLRRDVWRRAVAREEGFPRRRVRHAGVEVV